MANHQNALQAPSVSIAPQKAGTQKLVLSPARSTDRR
jgi:hypothetical protein